MLPNLPEIILIFVFALIILGPDQLPGLLRSIGKVVREFREISDGVMRELTEPVRGKPAFPTYKPRLTPSPAKPAAAETADPGKRMEPAPSAQETATVETQASRS